MKTKISLIAVALTLATGISSASLANRVHINTEGLSSLNQESRTQGENGIAPQTCFRPFFCFRGISLNWQDLLNLHQLLQP